MVCTRSFLACAALLSSTLLAQQSTAPTDLPAERGVYYRAGSNWLILQRSEFLPLMDGQALNFLSLGHRDVIAQIPGPEAMVRSGAKPVFYLRGFAPADGIYLVRTKPGREYRRVKMDVDRHTFSGPEFRNEDLVPFDVAAVAPDVVTLTPRTDLKPGEYVVVPAVGPSYRWIHFGFGFGVGQ
jgi:hypothetical protein